MGASISSATTASVSTRPTRTSSSASSSASTARPSSREPGSAWPSCSGSSSVMEVASGPRARSARARPFSSRSAVPRMAAREQVDILLVEDNQYDEKLTLRALRKHHLANHIHVVRDGAEALDFVFARAAYAGRYVDLPAKVILLDIKLPKVDGLEVLRQIREDPRTARQPVVMLTSSGEKQDIDLAYEYGANSYIVKPV